MNSRGTLLRVFAGFISFLSSLLDKEGPGWSCWSESSCFLMPLPTGCLLVLIVVSGGEVERGERGRGQSVQRRAGGPWWMF